MKVNFYDRQLVKSYLVHIGVISAFATLFCTFSKIPEDWVYAGPLFLLFLVVYFLGMIIYANRMTSVDFKIDDTKIKITSGDIFKQDGLKVIAFNEYFDTLVDDKIIAHRSLNGIFIDRMESNKISSLKLSVSELDRFIEEYDFDKEVILNRNDERKSGKKQKYKIGSMIVCEDFVLTAFSKFNENNNAVLTMPEYLEFLISFWDRINRVYAQRSVSVPIFGSGITRIVEHKSITDEDLLKIMIWTFRISEKRFKHPAKLNIVILKDKIKLINLFEIKNSYGF